MSAISATPLAPPLAQNNAATPHLPAMLDLGDGQFAPEAPSEVSQAGVDPDFLCDLALRLASTVPQFTTEWAADELQLSMQVVQEIYWRLKNEQLVEILGQNGPFSYRYAISQRGRERAARLLEICGYVGPAPVSLEAYSAMLIWQAEQFSPITHQRVQTALADLVLSPLAVEVAALAASSGRSLFLFGPPGNGKSSVARLLHRATEGDLWIPHCIAVGASVIRIFDPQVHRPAETSAGRLLRIDRRWVRVRRPFVEAGGEMTIDELDLAYSPELRFYEAPPHVKANGGVFLLDDFGRQRMAPHELLNRWIIPLEHRVDYLTLATGQKMPMPFRLMLVVATNLTVSDVADPAFLRRMGYRLRLDPPDARRYAEIFRRYAASVEMEAPPELLDRLFQRYQAEGRDLRCSEPRELIERGRDLCRLHGRPFALTNEILDAAWTGFFGNL